MTQLKPVRRRWQDDGQPCIVAATGPSLAPEMAEQCRGHPVIAVNDAWRLLPWADILYACDARWWTHHRGCPDFAGERWSSHSRNNDKTAIAPQFGLHLVEGAELPGFSLDPRRIHYGGNSGFQAVNLAILLGARIIVLIGFDMRIVPVKDGHGRERRMRHFFGDHPRPLRNVESYGKYADAFVRAAKTLPEEITIINATPESALTCFPMMRLDEALAGKPTTKDHPDEDIFRAALTPAG